MLSTLPICIGLVNTTKPIENRFEIAFLRLEAQVEEGKNDSYASLSVANADWSSPSTSSFPLHRSRCNPRGKTVNERSLLSWLETRMFI